MKQKFYQVADVESGISMEAKIQEEAQKRVVDSKGKLSLNDAISMVEREFELTDEQNKADKANSERTGKGTRVRVGQTRGKNPKVITWEAFDTDAPETCPESLSEFMDLTKTTDEKQVVSYLVDGFNASQYAAASDILAEFVEPNWGDKIAKQFKQTITNYSAATGVSLEDAVALIKPGILKAFNARLVAAQASK